MIAHSLICGTDTINGFSTGGITNSRTGTGLIRWFPCGEHPEIPVLPDYPEVLCFDLLKPIEGIFHYPVVFIQSPGCCLFFYVSS